VRTSVRRAAAALACTLLVGVTGGCTGDSDEPATTPPSSASTGTGATLDAKPVSVEVDVTRVAGTLSKHRRTALEHGVAKTVSAYFDAAFLSGRYPRAGFADAFRMFTNGAVRQARKDRDLLTNHRIGATTEQVVPKKQAVRLSVLAPYKVAAGVTGRVDLRYIAERGDRPAQKVRVTGELYLTHKKNGWRIFGYHVARSVEGATR
jgi:hypothetical protein